jgi:arabinan endo-1,5-alpha-L-arabinosidase
MKPKIHFSICCLLFAITSYSQNADIRTHDPSTTYYENGKYYNFSTGNGIQVMSSPDLKTWKLEAPIFEKDSFPKWILTHVPNFKGHFWAPDLVKMNGYYYLYYSCSTFGAAVSAIGILRNKTLDATKSLFKWEDLGLFVKSEKREDFNAIDPGLNRDTDEKVYLTYGSFHGGIGLCEIDSVSGKSKSEIKKIAGGRGADWEAPYIIKNDGEYFLFANNGTCCKGLNSTYYIVVGKSKDIFGPYLDKEGRDLNAGGASIVKRSEGNTLGPGHVGYVFGAKKGLVSTHFYDAADKGISKITFWNLKFKRGWPVLNPAKK